MFNLTKIDAIRTERHVWWATYKQKKKIDAIRDLQSHRNIHKVQSLTGFVAKFRFFYLNKII
jgi:hypothetical protein